MAQAERTAAKAKLADRLINGLSSEFARWTGTIEQFAVAEGKNGLCTAMLMFACALTGCKGTSHLNPALHSWHI